jgi:hypothetical protein
MTPKEKAKELVDKYDELFFYPTQRAKQCALIAVDEVLNNYYKNHFQNGKKIDYWIEVKQEIEQL